MASASVLEGVVAPLVEARGLDLFDLELAGGILRVSVDRPGGSVAMDEVAALTREISRALDERDPIPSRYTLEVGTPGLERTLRTPAQFAWAVGKEVSVKAISSFDGPRRSRGVLAAADERGVIVGSGEGEVRLRYEEIERARTIFEWGPTPKPSDKRATAS